MMNLSKARVMMNDKERGNIMNKDIWIKNELPQNIIMALEGRCIDELSEQEFLAICPTIFNHIISISQVDISGIKGYGEFDQEMNTQYKSLGELVDKIFDNEREGYWYHWKEIFDTTIVKEEFFEHYYNKLKDLVPYSEKERYFVNGNAFFEYLVLGDENQIAFIDWRRAGIFDWLMDITLLDLEKPYFHVPEFFYEYCKLKQIIISNFKERFLCMAYLKGLDTLRWHASIDDEASCESIMISIAELEGRLNQLIAGDSNEV